MTFNRLLLFWIALAGVTFIYLCFKPAPYGRHAQAGWGKTIDAKLAWLLMETPVLIIVMAYCMTNYKTVQWPGGLFIGLFCLHYINRCFIYPFRISPNSNRIPLAIVLSANVFNLVNGNVIGYSFTIVDNKSVNPSEDLFFIGIALFFAGMVINLNADNKLMTLKQTGSGYVIPKGGLYRFISSPNYFGEIAEWLGFALASGHLAAWSFFIWTVANLVPRALAHHKWYKEKFSEFPKNRKILVPFIW